MRRLLFLLIFVGELCADSYYAVRLFSMDLPTYLDSADFNTSWYPTDCIVTNTYDNYDKLCGQFKTVHEAKQHFPLISDNNVTIVKVMDYKNPDYNSINYGSILPENTILSQVSELEKLTVDRKALKSFSFSIETLELILKAFIALTLFTILATLIFKLFKETATNKLNTLRTTIYNKLTSFIEKDTDLDFSPKTDIEFIAFIDECMELINHYTKEESHKKVKKLHEYMEKIGAFEFLRNKIKDPFVFSKVEFIEKLGLTLYEQNKYFLFGILDSKLVNRYRIKEHTITGLSYLVNQYDMHFFMDRFITMKASGKYLEFIFSNIIKRLLSLEHHYGITYLLDYLYKTPNSSLFVKSFVEALGFLKCAWISNELCDLYYMSMDDGIKASIIRTFGNLPQDNKRDTIIYSALIDKAPLLRITASKSIDHCNLEDKESLLISCLSDSVYHVRMNLAISLSKSEYGISILEAVIETSKDKYAKDMAQHAIVMSKRHLLKKQTFASTPHSVVGNEDDYQ